MLLPTKLFDDGLYARRRSCSPKDCLCELSYDEKCGNKWSSNFSFPNVVW